MLALLAVCLSFVVAFLSLLYAPDRVLVAAAFLQADDPVSITMPRGRAGCSKVAGSAPSEARIIDAMLARHAAAMEMASLAETRSNHDGIRKMAKEIVRRNEAEISALHSLRARWYPNEMPAANPGVAGPIDEGSAAALAVSEGENFNRTFIDQMRKHQDGEIKLARCAATMADHAYFAELAHDSIEARKMQIAQLGKWRLELAQPD